VKNGQPSAEAKPMIDAASADGTKSFKCILTTMQCTI